LHTPPQSLDLNPIEHLWGILNDTIKKRHISNREDLKIALQEEWESISNHHAKTSGIDAPKTTSYNQCQGLSLQNIK